MRNIKKKILYILILFYKGYQLLIRNLYKSRYKFFVNKLKKVNVLSINETIDVLKNSNKSLSRFGDGEISWMLGDNKYGSFEKSSSLLRKRLVNVLKSNQKNLEIGLPDAIRGLNTFTPKAADFWKGTLSRYWPKLSKILDFHRTYLNTSVSRCYMDYNNKLKNRDKFKYTFNHLKSIWSNKNILIIEGKDTRLGATDDLFSDAKCIKRIECPPVDAFEHYDDILNCSKHFLRCNNKFLVLISLGPTATILAYDLAHLGYRAIDIGHVDLEYEWFLKRAVSKINIPTKYVNSYRIKGSRNVISVNNKSYKNEIYCSIK